VYRLYILVYFLIKNYLLAIEDLKDTKLRFENCYTVIVPLQLLVNCRGRHSYNIIISNYVVSILYNMAMIL